MAIDVNQTHYLVGKAVTPKLRSHRYFGCIGIVRGVRQETPNIRASIRIEMPTSVDAGGFAGWHNSPPVFEELMDDWMTA